MEPLFRPFCPRFRTLPTFATHSLRIQRWGGHSLLVALAASLRRLAAGLPVGLGIRAGIQATQRATSSTSHGLEAHGLQQLSYDAARLICLNAHNSNSTWF
jgi:hypothetical protein